MTTITWTPSIVARRLVLAMATVTTVALPASSMASSDDAMVTRAVINTNGTVTITVFDRDDHLRGSVRVLLAGAPLAIVSTSTAPAGPRRSDGIVGTIVATLPPGLIAGSYNLKVRWGHDQDNDFQLAIGGQGAIGPQGPAGPQGPQGPAGAQGVVGATGPQGAVGPAGPQGATGPQGQAGPQGLPGADGATGPAGAQGPQGPAGPQGAPGATGPQGDVGPAGPQGATGPQGPVGPQGLPGADGAAGPAGAQGPQGPAGPQGATGATGPQGDVGPTGPQGPAGASGTAPDVMRAIFGVGPITLYSGDFVLEAVNSTTLRLRSPAAGTFQNWSMIYPSNCTQPSPMSSVYRFTFATTDELQAPLCGEGSPVLVTAWTFNTPKAAVFRCWRLASNAVACQKSF